jgi:hypothetical protein
MQTWNVYNVLGIMFIREKGMSVLPNESAWQTNIQMKSIDIILY